MRFYIAAFRSGFREKKSYSPDKTARPTPHSAPSTLRYHVSASPDASDYLIRVLMPCPIFYRGMYPSPIIKS